MTYEVVIVTYYCAKCNAPAQAALRPGDTLKPICDRCRVKEAKPMTRAEKALECHYSTEFEDHGKIIARWSKVQPTSHAWLRIEDVALTHDMLLSFMEWLKQGLEEVAP